VFENPQSYVVNLHAHVPSRWPEVKALRDELFPADHRLPPQAWIVLHHAARFLRNWP
jgi:hypothetical protein